MDSKMETYTILVNTTDSFNDAWYPFFKLFSIYWPNYKGKIYLNTEKETFSFANINIVCVRNSIKDSTNSKLTWSECLIRALDKIPTEVILYLQEDYFLNSEVKRTIVNDLALRMVKEDIDCIHLTDQNSKGPVSPSKYPDLWLIEKNAEYRISCQAALWKKSVLKDYLRSHENPWQFEKYGTWRSSNKNHKFYCVNRNIYQAQKNEIVPYVFTGIIQGRWYEQVVDLFAKHGIIVDFSKRGFVGDKKKRSVTKRIKWKLKNLPGDIKSFFEIYYSKITSDKGKE